jgi:hypothetical protein
MFSRQKDDAKSPSKSNLREEDKEQMELTLVCARHLPKMDAFGTCDAYVVLRRGGKEYKSSTKKNTYAPDFGERFYFDVSTPAHPRCHNPARVCSCTEASAST